MSGERIKVMPATVHLHRFLLQVVAVLDKNLRGAKRKYEQLGGQIIDFFKSKLCILIFLH